MRVGALRLGLDRDGAIADAARSHSIAIDPDPAPISHKSSPPRGASAASVTARIRLLGDLPVVLEGIVRQTRARTALRRPARHIRRRSCSADRCRRDRTPAPSSRGCAHARRPSPQARSSATRQSRARKAFSRRAPAYRHPTTGQEFCGPARDAGCNPRSSRPCSDTSATSCNGQHRREAASEKAEGCGKLAISCADDMLRQHRARCR